MRTILLYTAAAFWFVLAYLEQRGSRPMDDDEYDYRFGNAEEWP